MFGCAWKINFPEIIFSWLCVLKALTRKWFEVKIFTSNHFQTRRERERERERAQSSDRAPIRRPQQHTDRSTVSIAALPRTAPIVALRLVPCRLQQRSHRCLTPPRTSLFLLLSIWLDLMNFFSSGFCFFCVSVLRNDIIYLFGS